ncbi:hypothetical protein NP233_g562 [Leucocoprinus birnbaumii]|uniref:Uncharacterized protein n=1 Tax=Leucocoprinus birnbaumii TaxID=56174 RepID=A0AAD5W5B7_9AGAR|nr:hypothetical protein NP233_g562 [Leucocoprinus birnbaumii]
MRPLLSLACISATYLNLQIWTVEKLDREKVAAERYNDMTPEERQRRRERGWDLEPIQQDPPSGSLPRIVTNAPPTPGAPELHIQTSALSLQDSAPEPPTSIASPSPLPFISQTLHPSHLKLNHFGSRFLPHSTCQIRCVLPLSSERLLLIGHDEGLSVLDMFPQEWSDTGGIDVKNPDEAQARLIWEGEGVFQMTIIEQGESMDGRTQGVVLALVGPEPGSPSSKDGDSTRALRMYNLLSLTSLAKWAIAQKGARPLDLRRPANWQAQTTPSKKHRHQGSITRGFKSFVDTPTPHVNTETQRPVSYQSMLSPAVTSSTSPDQYTNPHPGNPQQLGVLTPSRRNTVDSGWDVIDDVPLRWATDFVPLATPNSRLAGLSVISYAIWVDENRVGRGGQLLAVATRANILLYEVPKGERAFRFVKEFYTPMQPRNISFFHQIVQEVTRSMSDVTGGSSSGKHKRADSTSTVRDNFSRSPPAGSSAALINYGPQLSLFVVFDKKAGWIRIADSAVGEMELPDDSYISTLNQNSSGSQFLNPRDSLSATVAASTHRVRARLSFEHASPPKWILPVRCELPVPNTGASGAVATEITRKVIFLTRGRKTHILPSPLPTNYAAYPSLAIITWKSPPRQVLPRVCDPDNSDDTQDLPPFLQLVAFGEDGIEVQEMSLNFISRGKGKGKATFEEVIRAEDDVIGDCGFLASGGHWDQVSRLMDSTRMTRTSSTSSNTSSASYDSVGTSVIVSRLRREEGLYGWWKKGAGDFRIFWVGGSPDHDPGY